MKQMTQEQHNEEESLAAQKLVEHKLAPREYRAMLDQIQLEDLVLDECSAKVRREKLDKSMSITVKDKISHSLTEEKDILIDHSYELFASPGAKKDFALKILCTFRLRYSSNAPISKEFLEIFTQRNVALNTWPYFREFVQNMTQRMSIPPLTLPLLK